MKRFGYLVFIVLAFVLVFSVILSSKTIHFSDDGGGTNNTNTTNPQTSVILNEIPSAQANWNLESSSVEGIEFRV